MVFPVDAFVGAVNVATSVPFAEPLNSFTTGKLLVLATVSSRSMLDRV